MRFAAQHVDVAARKHVQVVVGGDGARPDQVGVLVDLHEREAFEDRQNIAVRVEVDATPPLGIGMVDPDRIGKRIPVLEAPAVELVSLHVHEDRSGLVAGGVEVEPGRSALRLVHGDAVSAGRGRSAEVSDGPQLLDHEALLVGERRIACSLRRLAPHSRSGVRAAAGFVSGCGARIGGAQRKRDGHDQ
jgi:hypothetical protein